jgi:hypothetical protein
VTLWVACMRNNSKPSTVSGDEWTLRLREKMQTSRGRFRRHLWVLLGVIVLLTGGLAWWLYRQTPVPPLTVVAFDNLCLPDEEVAAHARVEAREGKPAPSLLAGLDVVFADPTGSPLARTKTLGAGQATAHWSARPQEAEIRFLVRLLGTRQMNTSEDRASIFRLPRGARIVAIDVHDLFADPATDFATGDLNQIAVHAPRAKMLQELAKAKKQIVYLAVKSERAAVYRLARRWIESKQQELPRGPILGRPAYHIGQSEEDARQQLINELASRYDVASHPWQNR